MPIPHSRPTCGEIEQRFKHKRKDGTNEIVTQSGRAGVCRDKLRSQVEVEAVVAAAAVVVLVPKGQPTVETSVVLGREGPVIKE